MIDLSKLNGQTFNPEILYVCYHQNSKTTCQPHTHDFLELSIVISGQAIYYIEKERYLVEKGNVLLLNPNMRHYKEVEEGSSCGLLHIGFRNIFIEGEHPDYFPISNSQIKLQSYRDEFLSLAQKIIAEEKQKLAGYEIILRSLFNQLLIVLMRDLTSKTYVDHGMQLSFESVVEKKQIVNTIINYMAENYMNEISLEKLSENMYLSSVYISKIFKEETGDSPINYLIKLRLSHAYKLLASKQYSVKSVSSKIGYKDAYYFSKQFKKHYGYPPSILLKDECSQKPV